MNIFVMPLVLLAMSPTPSDPKPAGPRLKLPPLMSAPEVLNGFVQHVSEAKGYPASAVQFIQKQYEERKTGDNLAPLLDESLAVLSPEFKAGLDALAADKAD